MIQCNYYKTKESNVSLCKKDNPNYNNLKDLWKLILKNKNLSQKMLKALNLFKGNIKYIENSFKYQINNGRIEETNNLIKGIPKG